MFYQQGIPNFIDASFFEHLKEVFERADISVLN